MLMQVAGHERSKHKENFAKMLHHRKIVLHDIKKWDVNIVDEEYEIDEYDRDDTIYLMSFDHRGELVGSMRLISTAMPHMTSGPFKKMFPDVQFSSPNIWEATRFVVMGDHSVQPNGMSTAACELLLGTIQFGLENGVRHITGVYEASMTRLYRRCGLSNVEIARHRTDAHGVVCVGLWELSESLESSVIAATGLSDIDAPRQSLRAA